MSHEAGFVMGVHTRWLPMTRSHDPFPQRHSSHEILDVWATVRHVVTILPADSCLTQIWRQKWSNARICFRGSYGMSWSLEWNEIKIGVDNARKSSSSKKLKRFKIYNCTFKSCRFIHRMERNKINGSEIWTNGNRIMIMS